MIVHIGNLTFSGIDIIDVDVQVQILAGIPNFFIVGLVDKTIAEFKERVRTALSSIRLALPTKKILINLAPADLIKEVSHFDLTIACGILSSMNILPAEEIQEYLVIGELLLDGAFYLLPELYLLQWERLLEIKDLFAQKIMEQKLFCLVIIIY